MQAYKVTILPIFSGTIPELRLMFLINLAPEFVPVFLFRFYSVFLIILLRMETFMDLVSNFPDEETATVLRMEQ